MWFTHKVCVTVDASLLLLILLLLVFFLLLVFLRDHVVQVAQVMLGEHVVHGLAHSHQCQDLQNKEVFWLDPLPRNPRVFFLCPGGFWFFYHDREDNGSHCGLEDPEQSQTQALDEGEEVDASLGHVSQVDEVRLVFGWHQDQQEAIHELIRTD